MSNHIPKKIVILGAGLSGLALGWFLKKRHGDQIHLTILEKTDRVGGAMQTIQKEGFLFELGPQSCRRQPNTAATINLVHELNLSSKVIFPHPSAAKRYLSIHHQLKKVPTSFFQTFFSPWLSLYLSALWRDWQTPKGKEDDESIASFSNRRFGNAFTRLLIDPLTLGIYAGDIHKLSIRSCFPTLFKAEQERGSVLKGLLARKKTINKQTNSHWQEHPFFSFEGGMSTLIDRLHDQLKDSVQLNVEAQALHFHHDHVDIVSKNHLLTADYVFSTLPAKGFAHLLPSKQEKLIACLNSIENAPIGVVNIGFKKQLLKKEGFGYLIPSNQAQDALGMIWSSSIFKENHVHDEETRLTIMIKGDLSEEEYFQKALLTLQQDLDIYAFPDAWHVSRASIPQYYVGHEKKLKEIERLIAHQCPLLDILGYSYYGVSINDCIQKAESISNSKYINNLTG